MLSAMIVDQPAHGADGARLAFFRIAALEDDLYVEFATERVNSRVDVECRSAAPAFSRKHSA
ncbi:hypothetical protein, partial [Mesorhizobium sp. M0520]|uniref:hypothetical protein n=1 Tax=Mesorhizobium sp. M0520 TaxID=2956957 RepID=UPI00333B81D5